MSTPEWESSKENVQPIAQGRNVPALNKALVSKPEDLNRERAVHESAIRDGQNGIGPYAADPLAPWVMYVKWVVENFPRGSDLIVSVVEGACRRFAKEDRYRDDRRFVRLWIRYADLRVDKLDVFQYMHRHRIGETVALFYEAWATTLELVKQFDEAEKTYANGMRIGAQPMERLAQRQREYFARMAARARRAEKKAKDASERKKGVEKAKETLAGRSRATLADEILIRPETNDRDVVINDENSRQVASTTGTLVRPALGTISDHQAETGLRPTVPVPRKKVLGERPQLPQTHVQTNKTRKVQSDSFEVFSDPSPTPMSPVSAHRKRLKEADEFPFKPISKRDEVQKENGGLPSKWAGETLPQNPKAMRKAHPRALAERPHIEIFQESEEAVSTKSNPGSANASPAFGNINESQRPRSPVPARKSSGLISAVSPTINTKIALQEVEDLFNSSLPFERAREEAMARTFSAQRAATREQNSPKVASFEIYQDEGENNMERASEEKPVRSTSPANVVNKENALGTRSNSSLSAGPSGNPELEKRVLQPIEQLEDPSPKSDTDECPDKNYEENHRDQSMQTAEREQEQHNHSEDAEMQTPETVVPGADDLMDFLATWCYKEPGYHLLQDGPDPEVEKDGMFDLHPIGQPIVSFNVDMFLWSGYERNSEVVAVEDLNNVLEMRDSLDLSEDADDRFALKVSDTGSLPWEFYIYKTFHDRYGAPLESIPTAIALYEGKPRTYLVLDSVSVCSLAETMTLSSENLIPESVAMFLTTDLLRTLEALHTTGIIHGDVTLDNVLYRSDPDVELGEERYMASVAGNWSSKGVLLVDFNHAVDSKQAAPDGDMVALTKRVAQHGNDFLHPDYRVPNAASWSFNGDCYAAAICSAKLLKLEGLQIKGSKEALKHEKIWESYFDAMRSLSATSRAAETVDTMRRCREAMEGALFEEKGLRAALIEVSAQVEMKDAPDDTMC